MADNTLWSQWLNVVCINFWNSRKQIGNHMPQNNEVVEIVGF
jgi:hypothetical protein